MKILITSGGGAKGAFSIGVLRYLRDEMGLSQFDLISGTSTGALIASLASIGRLQELEDVYLNTTNADILQPQNIVDSITSGRPYVYDTEPLFNQIGNHINDATFQEIMNSPTILCLNAISLQSGRLTVFTTKDIRASDQYLVKRINSRELLINALLGSSNQAVFMNPVRIGAEDYVDGGNREVVPTRVVANNLDPDGDHEIYVLSNNPNELVEFPGKQYTDILEVLIRAISLFIQEVRENDLEVLARFKTRARGNVRMFYIYPRTDLDKQFPTGLRFDPGLMMQWMAAGRTRARDIIETTPGGNFPALRPF